MTLSAGSIAITSMNSDTNKTFQFVALVDIPAGEVIKFTDNGWTAAGAFRTGEGVITWTAPAGGVAKGTVVGINTTTSTPTATAGTATESGDVNFSTSGDQLLAYQGADATPTFLFAVNNEATGWQADATSSNTSALPTGLTNGVNAVAISEIDNTAYAGVTSGTEAELLAAIADAANWARDDANNLTGPASFTVTGGAAATVSIGDVSIAEGDAGTSVLTFTVTRSENTGAFTIDFETDDDTATAGSDYDAASGALSFTAGGALTDTISVTINGDVDVEADELFTVTLSNIVSSAGTATIGDGVATGAILNDDAAPPPTVVINEIDSDTAGTDALEFVEIYDGGIGNSSLNGLVLVFFNGGAANDGSYFALDLDGFTTDANGYFVAGNAGVTGVDAVFAGNLLQNGQDAVAIYVGDATAFPSNTAPTTVNLVDAIVYDTADADDPALLAALGETVQYDEAGAGASDANALARVPNGAGEFIAQAPTPGAANSSPGLVVAIAADSFSENGGSSSATVTRAGGSTAGDLVVTLVSSDTGEASVPATVTILDGEASATFTVTGVDDAIVDGAQAVTITASAGGYADGADSVSVTDDDGVIVFNFIHDVQGTAFFSPVLANDGVTAFNVASITIVTIEAIVTAIDDSGALQGFFLQEEATQWDADSRTSEGIFVMTRNDSNVGTTVGAAAPGLEVGERVQVTAKVIEYQTFENLPRTFLTEAVIVQSNVIVGADALTLDGSAGRLIPNGVLSDDTPNFLDSADDGADAFDPESDALDFLETVEGMLVVLPQAVVADGFVSGGNDEIRFKAYSTVHADADQINSRGGYTIAGDPALSAPDTAATDDDVIHGGRHSSDGDANPDILELDFSNGGVAGTTTYHNLIAMGDALGDVSGVIDFDFRQAKLYVTQPLSASVVDAFDDANPSQETTTLGFDSRSLRVATFNAENLAGTDAQARFDALAAAIAANLQSPDIIILEEVQDNDGAVNSGVVDASTTWSRIVDAVNAATGKVYQWVDELPTNNAEGGEPGGNIRVGFLYDTARVTLGGLDPNAPIEQRRLYTDRIGDGVRTSGDLIAYTDADVAAEINTADWTNTRRSLLGEFALNGVEIYVAAHHLPSKGGSDDFYELDQTIDLGNPTNADWAQRNEIAEDIWSTLNAIATADPDARIVSGGDYNDFYFYRPLEAATGTVDADGIARVGGARFVNLTVSELSAAERYSYTFDGRSQTLDHILADEALAAAAEYDIVHINTGFNGRTGAVNPSISDHDPALARFDLREFGEVLAGTAGADAIEGFGGDDSLSGGDGDDSLNGGAGIDQMSGGTGNDAYTVDSIFDAAIETADAGTDTVTANTPSFYLGANVENLTNAGGGTFLGYGNAGNNVMTGGAGIDQMVALGGADTANLGAGNDYYYAGDGDDAGAGDAGVDVLLGEAGNDTLSGGLDQDYLFGGNDADTLNGEAGGDVLNGEAGDDALFGGDGVDYFYAGVGADVGTGGNDVDIFVMEAGNDTAAGESGNDYFYMGGDNDTIYGGAGVDVMLGEAGNDIVDGGEGVDYAWLGAGDDTFVMNTQTPGLNVDVLNDFVPGAASGDVLRLLNTGWTTIAEVNAAMFNTGAGYSILTLDPDTQIWLIGILPGQLVAGDVAFS